LFPGNNGILTAELFRPLCLQFQLSQRVTRIDAFLKILKEEAAKPTKPFVLGDVCQFMHQQASVSPMLRLNEDTIAQSSGMRVHVANRNFGPGNAPCAAGSRQLHHHFSGVCALEQPEKRIHCAVDSSRHRLFVFKLSGN